MHPLDTLRSWPLRRWVAAAVLVWPVFAFLRAADGTGSATLDVLTLLTAAVGATVLASYLPGPGEGRRPVIGCTPCATAAGLSLVAAALLRASSPGMTGMALVALIPPVMGLRQRLTDSGTCVVRSGPVDQIATTVPPDPTTADATATATDVTLTGQTDAGRTAPRVGA